MVDEKKQALARRGGRGGALAAAADEEEARRQLMDLLARRVLRYTGGKSRSVRVETAQELLCSIAACIERVYDRFPTREEGRRRLAAAGMAELFDAGLTLLKDDREKARKLLDAIREKRPPAETQLLTCALDEELPQFVEGYDPEFGAHRMCNCLCYPLACEEKEAETLPEFLLYLETLRRENAYCSRYPAKELRDAMGAACRAMGDFTGEETELGENLFRLVFGQALLVALAGGEDGSLTLPVLIALRLQRLLASLAPSRREELFRLSACRLSEREAEPLRDYMRRTAEGLGVEFSRLADTGSLAARLSSKTEEAAAPAFQQGGRLPDRLFRTLRERVLAADDPLVKARLVTEGVACLDDLIDLLAADCLFDGEFEAVYSQLDPASLALLTLRAENETQDGEDWRKALHQYYNRKENAGRRGETDEWIAALTGKPVRQDR